MIIIKLWTTSNTKIMLIAKIEKAFYYLQAAFESVFDLSEAISRAATIQKDSLQ